MKKGQALIAAVALAGTMTAQAVPMDFDFSGTFTKDNDVVLLNFTVNTASDVTIFSSSWDDGGFDPILAIWDSAGNLIQQQDDGHNIGSTVSNGVSYDHGDWDSYFTSTLTPGTYTASIAQYNNFAVSTQLSDGFQFDASPNFRGGFSGRLPFYEFHILNVDQAVNASVPEPAGIALLGLGLAGFGLRRRSKAA